MAVLLHYQKVLYDKFTDSLIKNCAANDQVRNIEYDFIWMGFPASYKKIWLAACWKNTVTYISDLRFRSTILDYWFTCIISFSDSSTTIANDPFYTAGKCSWNAEANGKYQTNLKET